MSLEEIIVKMEALDEKIRLINFELYQTKEDLKIVLQKQKEVKGKILEDVESIKKLQSQQEKNNSLILELKS